VFTLSDVHWDSSMIRSKHVRSSTAPCDYWTCMQSFSAARARLDYLGVSFHIQIENKERGQAALKATVTGVVHADRCRTAIVGGS